jgi:hypothetical protein
MTVYEFTEAKIKSIIKSIGGPNSMPKKVGADKVTKEKYIINLLGVLRAQNENDFSKVLMVLEAELAKGKSKKGFGATSDS